jgi:hypothetical protein
MVRTIAKIIAKWKYVLSQEVEAATAELHAGLSLKLAAEKRAQIEQLNKEADDIDANIKNVDEQLAKGYWECENGHDKPYPILSTSTDVPPVEVHACVDCGAPAKLVSLATMSAQEKTQSDHERNEAQTIAANKLAQAKAEEENVTGSEQTVQYFKKQAASNRQIADRIRKL